MVRQGVRDKVGALREILTEQGLRAHEVAYVGDDLNDLPVLAEVGLSAAPADAAFEARTQAFMVLSASGGRGCLREFIEAILRARPDAVYNLLYGGDLVAFIRQARGTGLFERFQFLNATGGDVGVLEELGGDMPEGMLCGARYYFQHPDTEANRRFVKRYRDRFGSWPTPWAEMSYNGVRFLAAGLTQAGGPSSHRIVQALEGVTLELPRGSVTLRKEDHQAILDMVWGRTFRNPDFGFPTLANVQIFPGTEITPSVDEVVETMRAGRN